MPERRICSFSHEEIEPGTGMMFVKKDGKDPDEFFYLIQETTRLNDLYVSLFKEDESKLLSFTT